MKNQGLKQWHCFHQRKISKKKLKPEQESVEDNSGSIVGRAWKTFKWRIEGLNLAILLTQKNSKDKV